MSDGVTCAACGSDRMSPKTVLNVTSMRFTLPFFKTGVKRGVFSDDTVHIDARGARVCHACGHVMFYAVPESEGDLKTYEGKLEPKKM